MNDEAMFELLAPAGEAEFEFESESESESGKSAKKKPAPPVVLPALTIRDRPFVVLDRFVFDGPAVPAGHDAVIDRIARLIVASRVSGDPIETVRLVGHTDPAGKAPYNLGLAERRAKAVETKLRAALAALGRKPSVIEGAFNKMRTWSTRLAPRAQVARLALGVMRSYIPEPMR